MECRPYRTRLLNVNDVALGEGSSSGHKHCFDDSHIDDPSIVSIFNSGVESEPSSSVRKKRKRSARKKKVAAAIIGEPVPVAPHQMTNPIICEICGAKKFEHEAPYFCCFNGEPVNDQKVFNAPTSNEVAAIWADRSEADDRGGPYIVAAGKSQGIKRYPKHSRGQACPTVEPVSMAHNTEELIDLESEAAVIPKKKPHKDISCREYYAYLLQIRVGNRILATGRALLQFVVDMYVKLESTRLDFMRNNQSTIRADLYQGLVDAVVMGELEGVNAGHRIILPPSFIGGPRDMRRRYLNAMALVQRFGKPDIFATMTCNPNWMEIKRELKEGEKIQNRPDLVARVFRSKLISAKKEIIEKKIFGEVAGLIYVVEFQKRGLPHAHFLIILKPECKIRCPEEFDRFVFAEIPSNANPHL